MEMGFTALVAAIGGAAVVVTMFGHLLFSALSGEVKSRQSSPHVLEVSINGRTTKIVLNQIDTEDPAKIERTIAAVRAAKRLENAQA